MIKSSQTLFISDLHLDESHPEITTQFLAFLNRCDDSVDALYILGDLFEAWIGDDNLTPFNQKIISALKQATSNGLPIYLMYGNRDFLIKKRFLTMTGCRLLADETIVSLYGTHVLLMHGDMLCTADVNYLKARKRAHNKFIQTIFLTLPLFIRRKIAANMRQKSAIHTKKVSLEIMDVTHDTVLSVFAKHQVQYLIHGHTHKPGFHHYDVADQALERIVLGAWHPTGNALVWQADGRKQLFDLPSYADNG